MDIVGLVSGGKDSIYSMLLCAAHRHKLVCLANLHPPQPTELDSFMFQSVGVEIVPEIAKSMEVPLVRRVISGKSINTEL
jgi:diphthine-ammonia ligase